MKGGEGERCICKSSKQATPVPVCVKPSGLALLRLRSKSPQATEGKVQKMPSPPCRVYETRRDQFNRGSPQAVTGGWKEAEQNPMVPRVGRGFRRIGKAEVLHSSTLPSSLGVGCTAAKFKTRRACRRAARRVAASSP
uniref:Uncharacterized protein n=1 Tax=Micrurus surinamensis TaxID=129470 RepID=A0A2D4P941_MICSU